MILVLTNKWDISADFVIREMARRGMPYVRIHSEDIAGCQCTVRLPGRTLTIDTQKRPPFTLEDLRVVWYRRPGKVFDWMTKGERPPKDVQIFVNEQWATWLEAIELSKCCRWVNPCAAASSFENKIRQLELADQIGFRIPRTIISNDPQNVREFARACGDKIVAKALFSPLLEGEREDRFVFTNRTSLLDLNDDESLRISPTIFQEAICPKIDYRVTVVGGRVFAVKIIYPSSGEIDWRAEKRDVTFIPTALPDAIEDRCREFVARAGLVFGAIDLVESEGGWYFLEINPSGEWGWLQQPVGLPIAQTLCDVFAELSA